MLDIKDIEEKKLIVAYRASKSKRLGVDHIWRLWVSSWDNDFRVKGTPLKMYDHKFVQSKTKAREKVRAGEVLTYDYKKYDDSLADIYDWISVQIDKYRTDNTMKTCDRFMKMLVSYRKECADTLYRIMRENNLQRKGYSLKNQTSSKNPLELGHFLLRHNHEGTWETIMSGSYEEILDYLNRIIKEGGE